MGPEQRRNLLQFTFGEEQDRPLACAVQLEAGPHAHQAGTLASIHQTEVAGRSHPGVAEVCTGLRISRAAN